MPQLYIEEYTRTLSGRMVCIACREGILRDHFRPSSPISSCSTD